ncbi:expressed unknown protein [Seminavis robusta]|uniref:Uncharacterized protein n=1 Tax=Seminavis robusta TaxID=568900 RepID=A0A9N8HTB3_9STRA|nr:expressed unknown protein [Seminavis robusta]|eukprot:Sro1556_g282200.1 n/a (196) ;mRNA; r:1634-2221
MSCHVMSCHVMSCHVMSELLDAFQCATNNDDGPIDNGTIRFLLDTLENATEEDWEPILEPFVSDPSAIVQVLLLLKGQCKDTSVPDQVAQAKEILQQLNSSSSTEIDKEEALTSDNVLLGGDDNKPKYASIPGAHNRAISLRQLRQILQYIQAQQDPHTGTLPWVDHTSGEPLTVSTMNLYHVVDYIIKPFTAPY